MQPIETLKIANLDTLNSNFRYIEKIIINFKMLNLS